MVKPTPTKNAASTSSAHCAEQLSGQEELEAQVAIESSIYDIVAMQSVAIGNANEQVSDALMRSHAACDAKHVVHLKFTRRCRALREILMESMELAPARRLLEGAGFQVELALGLKVFVKPEHYLPVMAAIQGQALHSEDVVCEPELESIIVLLAEGIRKKEKVYKRESQVIPFGFLLAAKDANLQISFSKRSISIKVPSSLRSASATDEGRKTV